MNALEKQSKVSTGHGVQPLALVAAKGTARVDSRLLAQHLGVKHQNSMELLEKHKADFLELDHLPFQTEVGYRVQGGGKAERFALLTEDQAYLLLTYSRNTARTRALKVRLVKAFGEARRAAIQHGAEYLPSYHTLHDEIHALAAGSCNERFVHMNINRLINNAAGIDSGQRGAVALPVQSMLCVAQAVAARAVQGAPNHHAAYDRAKAAMLALSAVTMLEAGEVHHDA